MYVVCSKRGLQEMQKVCPISTLESGQRNLRECPLSYVQPEKVEGQYENTPKMSKSPKIHFNKNCAKFIRFLPRGPDPRPGGLRTAAIQGLGVPPGP